MQAHEFAHEATSGTEEAFAPLAARFTKSRYYRLAESRRLLASEVEALGEVAAAHAPWRSPDVRSWIRFSQIHLLSIGVVLVTVGVVFFFAANWSSLPGLARMALIAGAMTTSALFSLRLGHDSAAGRALITLSGLFTGPLLAVYGQTYQTGADSYELFVGWAVLLAPFALLARWPGTYLFQVVLLELGLGLYMSQIHGLDVFEPGGVAHLVLAGVNVAGWAASEIWVHNLHKKGAPVGMTRWLGRAFILTAIFFVLPGPAIEMADHGFVRAFSERPKDWLMLWPTMLVVWAVARRDPKDLFALCGIGLASVLLSTAEVGHLIHDELRIRSGFGPFLTGIWTLSSTFAVGTWVRRHMRAMGDIDDADERDRYGDAFHAGINGAANGGAR